MTTHFHDVTLEPRRRQRRTSSLHQHVYDVVYQRDEGTCQICSTKLYPVTHHIDHDTSNDSEFNLCILCNSCNTSINGYSKEYWTTVLTEKVLLKYKESSKLLTQDQKPVIFFKHLSKLLP